MNQLFSLLTVTSVLAHAVLGCCAHALQESKCCENASAACTVPSHHDHSHVCSSDEPTQEHAPENEHCCCRVKCQWLAPDAPTDLAAALLSYSAIFDADQIATSTFPVASARQVEVSPCDALPALPLRSHLVLGVLLI